LIVVVSVIFYLFQMLEAKKEQILADGHKQLGLLIEEPQFTLETAHHLRAALRRQAAPSVIVEVDDLIFDKLSRSPRMMGSS
jgi:hypothetical protein